jgi:hypothetical protein
MRPGKREIPGTWLLTFVWAATLAAMLAAASSARAADHAHASDPVRVGATIAPRSGFAA